MQVVLLDDKAVDTANTSRGDLQFLRVCIIAGVISLNATAEWISFKA
jgi:hypothetical protein